MGYALVVLEVVLWMVAVLVVVSVPALIIVALLRWAGVLK